jgi:chemosensory pili system protein ChpA (sensor histidine kinase/response regulator)
MMAESVSDVATVQTNLARHVEHAEQALIAQGRLSRALQQELVRVRTVPLGSVSARLYRVVRQTAKELGKKANLDIRGAQVEVDRTVLERLVGPIEHMIRNSIAHGLEDKARRNALGKAEIGELQLEARYEGNEIVIELADDGAGIHLERVRKRALERGLLAIGAEPSDAELAEFIFMPGFSTASEVTEIAGRGVGMDVVRAEVASLGGRLELSFERDRGTRFCISLPLTLAVTHVVLARAGSQLFAFPAATVEQIGQIRRDDLRAWRAAGTCAWAGRQYPFHHLAEVLSCGPATAEERSAPVLLLRCGAQRLAVQVDEIRGNVEVVMKPLGPQMQAIEGLAGATVLGDGSVVLVLHPAGMARRLSAAPRTAAVAAPAESADAPPAQILVVDDSVTVRKVTSRLLEREGYRVDTAKDGVEALQKIGRERPDVLLVDIEMPRMDGFDLTRHLRADRRFAGLPIIMITSRNADKHHKHALDLGVSVFLGKPYEENTLLECVAAFSATRH